MSKGRAGFGGGGGGAVGGLIPSVVFKNRFESVTDPFIGPLTDTSEL